MIGLSLPEGYIGFVEELPGANTQGARLEEARANLQEAVAMVLEANREVAQQAAGQGPVIRESLKVSASNGARWFTTSSNRVADCSGKVAITRSSSVSPAEHQPFRGTPRSNDDLAKKICKIA